MKTMDKGAEERLRSARITRMDELFRRINRLLGTGMVISCLNALPPHLRRPPAPPRSRLISLLERLRSALIRVIRAIRGRRSPIANRKSKIENRTP